MNQTTEGLIYGEDDRLHSGTARLRDQSGARTGSKSFLRRILIFPCKKRPEAFFCSEAFFCRASQNLIPAPIWIIFVSFRISCFVFYSWSSSFPGFLLRTHHSAYAGRRAGIPQRSDSGHPGRQGAFELLRENPSRMFCLF